MMESRPQAENKENSKEVLSRPEGKWEVVTPPFQVGEEFYGTYNRLGNLVAYVSKVEGGGGVMNMAPADQEHLQALEDAGYEKNEALGVPFVNTGMPDKVQLDFKLAFGENWSQKIEQQEKQ